MELHFKIIGVVLMLLGLMHVGFPMYFNWKEELKNLSPINKEMMQYHTLFIALMSFLMGLMSFALTEDLVGTKFGKQISLGIGVFWSLRAVIQFFGYSPKVWKGKRLETVLHIFFSGFWIYMSVVYLKNYWL